MKPRFCTFLMRGTHWLCINRDPAAWLAQGCN